MKSAAKLPTTKPQWQAAVDAAHGALALDAARQYGLVTGGPKVDADRCAEILRLGKARGITPEPDAIERFISATTFRGCKR